MTSEEVWGYIRMLELPYNSLHERGFISIGCEPCTRPVLPNQHEREGRWWSEESTQKECGLHDRQPDQQGLLSEGYPSVGLPAMRTPIAGKPAPTKTRAICRRQACPRYERRART